MFNYGCRSISAYPWRFFNYQSTGAKSAIYQHELITSLKKKCTINNLIETTVPKYTKKIQSNIQYLKSPSIKDI